MKIYFAGSIRGGRKDIVLYQQMIGFIERFGEVLTEHIGDPNLSDSGEIAITDSQIHDRDMIWLKMADLVIAEVSTPSLGVGYEIGRAIESGKDIICVFCENHSRTLSAMISGCPNLTLLKYTDINDFKRQVKDYFSRSK